MSSTLNDDKHFGKQNMLDACSETCWNSAHGEQQFIVLQFETCVNIRQIQFQFQGGFAPKVCFGVCIFSIRYASSTFPKTKRIIQTLEVGNQSIPTLLKAVMLIFMAPY